MERKTYLITIEGDTEVDRQEILKDTSSNRAKEAFNFHAHIFDHIENYTVPQYGDYPNDQMTTATVDDICHNILRYCNRVRTNARGAAESLKDMIKIGHYAGIAFAKIEAELEELENTPLHIRLAKALEDIFGVGNIMIQFSDTTSYISVINNGKAENFILSKTDIASMNKDLAFWVKSFETVAHIANNLDTFAENATMGAYAPPTVLAESAPAPAPAPASAPQPAAAVAPQPASKKKGKK